MGTVAFGSASSVSTEKLNGSLLISEVVTRVENDITSFTGKWMQLETRKVNYQMFPLIGGTWIL